LAGATARLREELRVALAAVRSCPVKTVILEDFPKIHGLGIALSTNPRVFSKMD
jgi:hypothetical protein